MAALLISDELFDARARIDILEKELEAALLPGSAKTA